MTGEIRPLVVDIGPLRETHYTGIPNVIAEICTRLLREDWLEPYFVLDGRWIDTGSVAACLRDRSGASLGPGMATFRPAQDVRAELEKTHRIGRTVALYTDHRPGAKLYPREGKIVYDLSMLLAPECHPASSVAMYTADLPQQIANSDVLFPISQSTARDLQWMFGVDPARIKVALLGSTVSAALVQDIRDRIGDRAVEPYLLVLGSVEPRKNIAMVLAWLTRYPEILQRVRVVFSGRQAWGATFEASASGAGLQAAVETGRIVFTGFVDERVKTALLVGACGLLYPSLFEGFGLPLLEAMAVGTPVLSSVSTSMPEVVGDCGYYFDPYSLPSLNLAFERLWADRQSGAVQAMTGRGQARAAGFSYDATYRAIIDGLFPDRA